MSIPGFDKPPFHAYRYARLSDAAGPYRVGRKCPWNVYKQIGPEPSDDDVALFDAGRYDIAELVITALNAHRERLL